MNRSAPSPNRWIIHLDMDAFYAAVEQHDQPSLAGKPVIVGGGPPDSRGVVSTCSYEARRYGVHSAMPLREAARLCPRAVFVPARMARYVEVSRQVFAIMDQYSPLIEPISLDEGFVDVTGCERLLGPAACIARQMVARIREELGLSASAGIAPNKFLAKVASDLRKPGGFVLVRPDEIERFLDDLPVGRLWGVGPKTEEALKKLGVSKIGTLRRIPREVLTASFGETGALLYELSRGQDERVVVPWESAKSISQEITFQQDTLDRPFLSATLLLLADRVARRARLAGLVGRTVVLKLRDRSFTTITRRRTLDPPTDFEETIYAAAKTLAEEAAWGKHPVRLVGVGLTNLQPCDGGHQGKLFGDPQTDSRLAGLHKAMDQVRERYGEDAIVRAAALQREHEKS
jgi:DNA polymerase IV